MTKLTSEAVDTLMKACLVDNFPTMVSSMVVNGLVNNYCFDKTAIIKHSEEIRDLLSQLPDNFQANKGGGWSFLNACESRDGVHWGEHRNMESLFCLGIAAGEAKWLMREMADIMPGGVPYVVVGLNPTQEKSNV
jgi:hypothetical protein